MSTPDPRSSQAPARRTRPGVAARLRRRLRMAVATQRVFVAPPAKARTELPIFIIGVHRSGTTLLRLVLDSHSRIAVPRESVFLLPLSAILREESAWQGLGALGFEPEHVFLKLREFSDYFFDAYAAARGKPRWADKSPQYVDCLDFIDKLYGPACKYLFIYRHGLDVANSIGPRQNIKLARPHKEACGDPVGARVMATQCQKCSLSPARIASACMNSNMKTSCKRRNKSAARSSLFWASPGNRKCSNTTSTNTTSAASRILSPPPVLASGPA
jgi:hypothetical protein